VTTSLKKSARGERKSTHLDEDTVERVKTLIEEAHNYLAVRFSLKNDQKDLFENAGDGVEPEVEPELVEA